MAPADYLKKPYTRLLVPEDDGSYRAEMFEFPGCIATGDTANDALSSLEEVAASWIESALSRGQKIPEPIEDNDFSGKLVLRIPKGLHKKAAYAAQREGVSLNQYIVSALAAYAGTADPKATAIQTYPAMGVVVTSGYPVSSLGGVTIRTTIAPSHGVGFTGYIGSNLGGVTFTPEPFVLAARKVA